MKDLNNSFYIVYQDYEVPTLNLDYFQLKGSDTIRYSLDKKQAILRVRDECLQFFNLSRAVAHDQAVALVSGLAWTVAPDARPTKTVP